VEAPPVAVTKKAEEEDIVYPDTPFDEVAADDAGAEYSVDVSDMYEIDDKGVMYQISETGEKEPIGYVGGDDDFEDDSEDTEADDGDHEEKVFRSWQDEWTPPRKRKDSKRKKSFNKQLESPAPAPGGVQVGDEVQVYIQSVSMQSGRFMVTLDPAVQNMSSKEMKQSKQVSKKMTKLVNLMGGEAGFKKLLDMTGTEGEGTIMATSQTGDWFYVQPELFKMQLPVGVGMKELEEQDLDELKPGDKVQIRLDGVDRSRGQLAVKVLGKLAP
jgi:hypothetical protein